MLFMEIIAVCSQIQTKQINTLRGQNVELLSVKLVVRIVTTKFWGVNNKSTHTHTQVTLITFVNKLSITLHAGITVLYKSACSTVQYYSSTWGTIVLYCTAQYSVLQALLQSLYQYLSDSTN
jgi:hypothetical protein